MVDENKDRRGGPADGAGARIGENIKAMASVDETGGAVANQGVDPSLAPLPLGLGFSCLRFSIPCMELALKRLWGQ